MGQPVCRAGRKMPMQEKRMDATDPPVKNSTPDAARLQARIHELEQALKSTEAARIAAVAELDDLARFLSHDLRAPLRGIDGYSKTLAEEYGKQLDGMGLAYLQYISDSGRMAAGVVDKLIHYIRIPRSAPDLQPLDLSSTAIEAAERVQNLYKDRQVALRVQPGLVVQADSRLARILLEYLLDNSWKFTNKKPGALVEVGQLEAEKPPVFFVRDNGVGFNMAYQANLFVPFQRLHSAHEFEGAGMGLAVAHRIVECHGGRIWAQGEVNAGAAVFFTLEPDNSK